MYLVTLVVSSLVREKVACDDGRKMCYNINLINVIKYVNSMLRIIKCLDKCFSIKKSVGA